MVKLLDYTFKGSDKKTRDAILYAARTCYDSFNKQNDVSDDRLLTHLIKNNESPLEFVDFTFEIKCSRVCSHQLVRHRIASYAQRSQRYVKESEPDYYIPDSLSNGKAYPEYNNMTLNHRYSKLMDYIYSFYDDLIAEGIPSQDARYVLPNSCMTTIITKFNLRSFRNFLKLRLSKKAQSEIRQIAEEMKELVSSIDTIFVIGF